MFTIAKDSGFDPDTGGFRQWDGMIRIISGCREESSVNEAESGPGK